MAGTSLGTTNNSIIQHGLTGAGGNHPLEAFFGPLQGTNQNMRADMQLAHETYNMPESFKGRNLFLEQVLDMKIRKEDEFYTRDLLPWQLTDDLHVAWEVFSFNRTLADLEPHQGVPRYVSAQQEAHSDNLLRRGLAFIIEHGFYKTERGKRHFSLNLQQISDAVHTTCYFGVIQALLQGQNFYKEWQKKYGQQVLRANDLMQAERRRFMIVQKSKTGLYTLDAELKHELKREGVVPNVFVLPDKMGIYINMVSGNALEFKEQGNQAIKNREYGDQQMTFRGTKCFETNAFDVEFSGQPVDLLTREQQIGSWYLIPAPDTANDEDGTRYIYSADKDGFEKITHAKAFSKCVNLDPSKTDNPTAYVTPQEGGSMVDVDKECCDDERRVRNSSKDRMDWA